MIHKLIECETDFEVAAIDWQIFLYLFRVFFSPTKFQIREMKDQGFLKAFGGKVIRTKKTILQCKLQIIFSYTKFEKFP